MEWVTPNVFYYQMQTVFLYHHSLMWFKHVLAREVRLHLNTKAPVCLTVCVNLWPASTNLYSLLSNSWPNSGSEMIHKHLYGPALLLEWKVLVSSNSDLLTPFFSAPKSSVPQIVVQMCWRTCDGLISVFSVDKAFNGPSVWPLDRWWLSMPSQWR